MRHAAVPSSFLGLAVAGLLAGCPDRSISEVIPQQGRVELKDIPVKINRDVDLLFVIDDSPSMADKQANLADNFPRFIEVLSTIQGGLPNVHIGVVTSDMGSYAAVDMATGQAVGAPNKDGYCANRGKKGELQVDNGAPLPMNQLYISDLQQPDGTRSRNYTVSAGQDPVQVLSDVFGKMAKVGASGCGFEQHLEAMKTALQPSTATNLTFLRPSAYLAVIFIADEDDCSIAHTGFFTSDESQLGPALSFRCTRYGVLCDDNGKTTDTMNQVGPKAKCHPNDNSALLTTVNDYVTFLKNQKPDDPDNKIIVAGIMGTSEPFATEMRAPPGRTDKHPALQHSCTYIGGDGTAQVADPPIRLKYFLDQFPNRSTFAPICQRDLSGGLQQIADLLKAVIGDPCIQGKLADVDPKTPELDYECSVSAVVNPTKATREETILPRCDRPDATATVQPCWHLATDAMKCPSSDHFLLKVEGQDSLMQDTHIIANCVTAVQ